MESLPAIEESIVLCPICSGRGSTYYIENGRRFERCRCGLVFQNPRPTDTWLHQAIYQPYDEGEAHEDQMEALYDHAASVLPRGRILDIGSGPGVFVRKMRALGWDAEGIDLCVGPEKRGDFLTADLEGPFDAVTAFYVLEHVSDPHRFIKKITDLLRPGGMAYIRVPHTSPIVRLGKLIAPGWNFYHTPWHLQDFPPKLLQNLFPDWKISWDWTQTSRGAWSRWISLPGRSYTMMAKKPFAT
jgi:SAM-dependent methyltransferase